MIKVKAFLIIFIFFIGCSLNSNSKFWTEEKKIEDNKDIKIVKIFKDTNVTKSEFNKNIKIRLDSNFKKKKFYENLDNNFGHTNYNGELKKISKYSFSKINDYKIYKPDPIFHEKGIIFFDSKGTIINFDFNSKLLWKKNIYTKKEKNLEPILYFAINKNYLIVADNLAKYYALDLNSGKILWTKQGKLPFNSQIKSYKDSFFLIDYKNILRCISIFDGSEKWKVVTDNSLLKSKKRISNIISNDKIVFINNVGDITAANIFTGEFEWQIPTQDTSVYASTFDLKNSDLVLDEQTVYFSNTKNGFYSIDVNGGTLNWKQDVNSEVRPIVIGNLIFTISTKGNLTLIDKLTGNIIRVTNLFDQLKKKEKKNITPVGFTIGKKHIYLTTNNGKLFLIDIFTGKTTKIIKIDNQTISEPFIVNNNLYLVKDNSIIKLK